MRFMVFYNLYFMHLSVYLTHGYRTIHLFPFFRGNPHVGMPETQHDHFLRILFCEYGTFMVVDKLFESILILTGYFSDVHILARPGVFADMDFEPFPAFRLFGCCTLPQTDFRIVVNLPVFTCPVMPPMLETAGSPCLEPYIACLYQQTLTAMHIAFDTLFVTGHEWNTGKIPEYNVIWLIYKITRVNVIQMAFNNMLVLSIFFVIICAVIYITNYLFLFKKNKYEFFFVKFNTDKKYTLYYGIFLFSLTMQCILVWIMISC